MNANRCRILGWAALMMAAGLGVVGFRVSRARSESERRLTEARAEGERLRAELRAMEKRAIANAQKTGESAEGSSGSSALTAVAAKPAFPPRDRPPTLSELTWDNPQLWNEFVSSKRVEMGRFYLPLMQRLNLTAAQRERMKDILAEDVARGVDISTAAAAQGLKYEDPVLAKLSADSAARRRRELEAVLGAAGLKEFEDFERATPMRGAVDGFAVQVAAFAPLTSHQADQLERALAQSNAAYRDGRHAEVDALDWAEADRRAREILSPQQFAAWKLGVAHNSFGGVRIERDLQRAYKQAIERTKRGAAQNGPE